MPQREPPPIHGILERIKFYIIKGVRSAINHVHQSNVHQIRESTPLKESSIILEQYLTIKIHYSPLTKKTI